MSTRISFTPPSVASDLGVAPPDAARKTTGRFSYSSDLWIEGMLFGATLRSPHAHARIAAINTSKAIGLPGVRAILTHQDVPGVKTFGLSLADQPVLAIDEVRYVGEAVAIAAADSLEEARDALEHVAVTYVELPAVTDPEAALAPGAPLIHPTGNVIRHLRVRKGNPNPDADVVVRNLFEVGMQDQAPLGPESALAIPTDEGGIELYVSTQSLHEDLRQVSASLSLPEEKIRVFMSGIGGAFGGKEDISVQIHSALLALATQRPVKMVYGREESFYGHPHRHPARLEYEHRADRGGRVVFVKARIVLDGGAYASTSTMVAKNAGAFAIGPYDIPNAHVDCYVVYTNNPIGGSMRGMGAPQVCFAYEAQMNSIARRLGSDPIELRLKNALHDDSLVTTGQPLRSLSPVSDILHRLRDMPLPAEDPDGESSLRMPGGVANVTHGEGVVRGIGYAIGVKGFGFSEGRDDSATATIRLSLSEDRPVVEVSSAAAEMGQGIAAVQIQIARDELGVEKIILSPADTRLGPAGSSSASRQTYMTGGAIHTACNEVKAEVLSRARRAGLSGRLRLTEEGVVSEVGELVGFPELLRGSDIEKTAVYHHRRTQPLDPQTGQGDAFVGFMFAGHRAVVDVDTELGLVRVVELAAVQDVGRVINRQGVEGQIEGGSAQGLGLAIMEELQVKDGHILNASFTDYLLPTAMDMPPVRSVILEYAAADSPLGVKGAGEAPTVSSGAAIIAAIEQATGVTLTRVPIRPQDVIQLVPPAGRSSGDEGLSHASDRGDTGGRGRDTQR